MNHGKAIWTEDDCTIHDPDHETLDMAWKRLFGTEWVGAEAILVDDHGDGCEHLMPNGYVVWASWPGASAIYAPA